MKMKKMVTDSAEMVFSAADGDQRISVATAVSLTRNISGKEQRIVVTGDADLMSNTELLRYNVKTANFAFNIGLFSWLSYGEFPVDTSRPDAKDDRLNVTSETVSQLNILFVWVLPGILLALGTVLLIRRKRK
jgi:ABC-2 type transport system permease protein